MDIQDAYGVIEDSYETEYGRALLEAAQIDDPAAEAAAIELAETIQRVEKSEHTPEYNELRNMEDWEEAEAELWSLAERHDIYRPDPEHPSG